MKNETGLHFLGWMILANLSDGWLGVGCVVVAAGYAIISLVDSWRPAK
jgi:hypothetical protein